MIADLKPYADYKESGLPWLGQVPEHWDALPLAGLARQKSVINQLNRQLLSVYLQRGVIKFVDVAEKRTNATSENLSKYQAVDPGDFVLNSVNTARSCSGSFISQAGVCSMGWANVAGDGFGWRRTVVRQAWIPTGGEIRTDCNRALT